MIQLKGKGKRALNGDGTRGAMGWARRRARQQRQQAQGWGGWVGRRAEGVKHDFGGLTNCWMHFSSLSACLPARLPDCLPLTD